MEHNEMNWQANLSHSEETERQGPGWDPKLVESPKNDFLAVAVTSGKGGVGKTNLVTNLAVAMSRMGRRVLLLDGDLSLANVDLLLGLAPRYNLYDVVTGQKRLDEIVLDGPQGIRIIPASSGVEEMANLDDYRREVLVRSLEVMAQDRDVLLIDTGSGIHRQNLRLAQLADEILVVTTPEPTAFSDAYATIKVLSHRRLAHPPRLIINMARTESEALRVADRVTRVAKQFLGFEPELFGVIPNDEAVKKAVKAQKPFIEMFENAPASSGVFELAKRLLDPTAGPALPAVPVHEKQRQARAA
jgi:flagellar biosynthesis protein FlhG